MPFDRNIAIQRAFNHLAPQNPLLALNEWDRTCIWSLLVVYAVQISPDEDNKAAQKPLRNLSKLVAEANKLGEALQLQLFVGPFAEILRSFTTGFEDLPARLTKLSTAVGNAVGSMGKPGHEHKAMANVSLAAASEFVRMKTGQHYDEHLAELFQAVASNRRLLSEDLSGDAIRKKREYLAKNYPALHSNAFEQATRMCRDVDRPNRVRLTKSA